MPKPPYPPLAKATKAAGTVVLKLIVDEGGNVISARVVSGHPLLQASSVATAFKAKFHPMQVDGQSVKFTGVISYEFQSRLQQ